jgi:hypothetical protein
VAQHRVMSNEDASGVNFPAICLQISHCAAGAQQWTKLFTFQSTRRGSQPKMFPLGRTTSRALASRTITAATVTSHLVRCPQSVTSIRYVVPGASLPGRRTYLNARYSMRWTSRIKNVGTCLLQTNGATGNPPLQENITASLRSHV